jgi:hypothetical protein
MMADGKWKMAAPGRARMSQLDPCEYRLIMPIQHQPSYSAHVLQKRFLWPTHPAEDNIASDGGEHFEIISSRQLFFLPDCLQDKNIAFG